MTEVSAIILYYQYLSTPKSVYRPFLDWYHQSEIEIESSTKVKRFIKATGYPGSTTWEELKQWVLNKIKEALGSFEKLYDILKTLIQDLINALKNVFKSIGQTVLNIIEFIREGIATMVTTITSIITNVSAWIKATLIAIKDSLVKVVTSVKEFLEAVYLRVKEAIIGAIDAGINAVKTAVAWAGKTISTILKWLGEKIIAIKDWIVNAVKVSVAWAGDKLGDMKDIIAGVVKTVWDALGKVVKTVGDFIKESIFASEQTVIETFFPFLIMFQDMVDGIKGLFAIDLDKLEEGAITVASAIVRIQQKISEEIGEATT